MENKTNNKETQLSWKKVNSKKLDLGFGHNVVVSSEDLLNEETNGTTRFIVIKKWKSDDDGVTFKKPTKMYIQEKFWETIKSSIDSLKYPN